MSATTIVTKDADEPVRARPPEMLGHNGGPPLDEPGILIVAGQRWFSDPAFCAMYKIARRTLLRWDKCGIGPPKVKIGGKLWRGPEEKLPAWMENHRVLPPSVRRGRRAR